MNQYACGNIASCTNGAGCIHIRNTHVPNIYIYICSAQSENLRNLEIALRILRIPRLRSNLKIEQAISRLSRQSRDCAARVRNLEIVQHVCAISRSRDLYAQSTDFELWLDLPCSSRDGRRP